MVFRKQKSRKQQAAELAADYLKVKAVDQDGQGRPQGDEGREGHGGASSLQRRRRSSKRIPVVLGAGLATIGGS